MGKRQAGGTIKRQGLAAIIAAGTVVFAAATAQADSLVLVPGGASPMPPDVDLRFCYYAGLAYSPGSIVTIDVPNRREVVTDRSRKAFRCIRDDSDRGRHFWQELDPDEGDPFRN